MAAMMDLADWEETRSYGVAQGYETVKVIGRGSFGKALLVQDRHGTQRVMKVVELQNASERRRQQAPMEAEMLQRLGPHPHIVRFHESFQEDFAFVIVMDFSRGGDLRQQIKPARSQHRSLPEPTLLQWLTQAFLGLKHIHGLNIIHRDMKSENLFLDGELQHLHIGDLGIACMLQAPAKVQLESSVVGTPYYLSPETCSMGIHSKASDLWAMGCVLYELTALKLPFYAPSLHELLQDIAKKRAPPLPSTYSNELAETYAALMSQNRNKRPSCKEVLCMRPFSEVLQRLDTWDSQDEEMVKVLTQKAAEETSKAEVQAAQREPGTVAALRRVQELRRQAEAATPGARPPLPGEEVTYAPDTAGIVETDVLQIDRPQTPRIPGDCQELLQRRPWSSRRPASAHRGKQKAKLVPLDAKPEATRVTCTVLDRRLTAAQTSALGAAEALRQAAAFSRKQSLKRQEARDASASASQSQVRSRALVRSESEPPMERA